MKHISADADKESVQSLRVRLILSICLCACVITGECT